MKGPTFLILCGDGINCERETAMAFELAQAHVRMAHVNELIANPHLLDQVQGLALPGGFSFGDELGSGQLLSLKIKHGLKEIFEEFVARAHPVIGICNGFQVLAKLGLLPNYQANRTVALAPNIEGKFINRWVDLKVHPTNTCHWASLLPSNFALPIRHGEGRVVLDPLNKPKIFQNLLAHNQVVLTYGQNPNGSDYDIAGICDPTGTVLGLMPHPEAAVFGATNYLPSKNPQDWGAGYYFFKSIVQYLQQK